MFPHMFGTVSRFDVTNISETFSEHKKYFQIYLIIFRLIEISSFFNYLDVMHNYTSLQVISARADKQ